MPDDPMTYPPCASTLPLSRRPRTLAAALLTGFLFLPLSGCKGHSINLSQLFHHRKSTSKPNSTDYASNLQSVVGTPKLADAKWPDFTSLQQQVQQFYTDRNWELAWSRNGKPTEQATRLVQIFGDAAKKGLQPTDYDTALWPQRTAQLAHAGSSGDTIAQFDVAMTVDLMRYLSDLHLGRINPQTLNFDIDVPTRRQQFNMADLLNNQLVDADDVTTVLNGVEPQSPMYQKTEAALPHYLELAQKQASEPSQPLPDVTKAVAPGGAYPAVAQLAQRLSLEGDLPSSGDQSAAPAGSRYTPELSQAVQQFQNRHGLNADGKLSKDTIAALNIPMSVRVQQINDSLESWRWLPDNFVKPRVLVNLPEYYVRTYDDSGNEAFKMKVVDGQSKDDHNTPVFVRTMRYLIFRPYWNLPTDIVKKDLLARHASTSYFDAHGYEVVDRAGKPVSGWSMDDLEHARYLVRQKPGPENSLGLVKFMFPNEYDIYLHSTPEMNLFNLAERDRSHGCIRLNDAEKMANWVLNGQGDWNADKIHMAMFGQPLNANGDQTTNVANTNPADAATGKDADSGPTSTSPEDINNKQVNLQNPLTVSLMYLTANADEDGTMHFFDDMYGYNKSLEAALAQPRPYNQATVKINPKVPAGGTD